MKTFVILQGLIILSTSVLTISFDYLLPSFVFEKVPIFFDKKELQKYA